MPQARLTRSPRSWARPAAKITRSDRPRRPARPDADTSNTWARTPRRMEVKRGTAVSPGVAIGPALVIDTEGIRITHRTVLSEQIPEEISRLRRALDEAAAEARQNRQRYTDLHGPTVGNIFAAHESALEAPATREQIETLIRT